MKLAIILIGLCTLLAPARINAQSAFKVPENLKLEKDEDYAKYEKDVVACVNWLEKTPLGENAEDRKKANAFLIQWISGSPDVTISLYTFMSDYTTPNAELLMLLMGGWTRHTIETKDKTETGGCLAGLETVAKFYKSGNKNIAADKNLDKLVAMMDGGKLEAFVKDNIKEEKSKTK